MLLKPICDSSNHISTATTGTHLQHYSPGGCDLPVSTQRQVPGILVFFYHHVVKRRAALPHWGIEGNGARDLDLGLEIGAAHK